jgi:ELWxxDGT repeat protein
MARLLTAALVAASLLLVAAVTSAEASAATTAVLVKDIVPGAASSFPYDLVNLNDTVLFSADDGVHGRELWKSDGTAAGTVLVRDINPGPGASAPSDFVELNGTVFFAANDGTRGGELWKTDGTAAGTSLVADINPGPTSSSPYQFVNFNGKLFFSANDGVHGREPWMSDGTSAGTRLLRDIISGGGGFSVGFARAMAVEDTLFFLVENVEADSEQLWTTDGTTAGTAFVARTDCVDCDHITEFWGSFNGVTFITVHAGCCGFRQLLRSDGTPEGTYPLDYVTWATSSVFEGAFYYFDRAAGDPGEGTSTLRRSDGTLEGTAVVKDLIPGNGPDPSAATVLDGKLLFFVQSWHYPPGYTLSLWASDGTAGGTGPLFDIGPVTTDKYGYTYGFPYSTTAVGGSLFFAAGIAGGGGLEPWTTDGTAAGTYLVRDINPDEADSRPQDLTAANGTLFFIADDGVHGRELWKTTPPLGTEPQRSDYKNGSRYCTALREFLGGPEFSKRYNNRGKCVSANH